MTAPLSDTRLDMHRRLSALSRKPYGDMETALAELLAEVDRLRAVVADYQGEVVRYDADHERLSAELGRLRADVQRIQRWATETVHGSAAAEVLLLIRDLAPSAAPFRNCFTDEAYRSSLTASPERPCDRVRPHPAHKHVAQRASWQCPGVAAASVGSGAGR